MLTLLIGFALGCMTLLLTALFKDFRHLTVARVFASLLLAAAGFLVHPLVPEPYSGITSSVQTLIPALFWLLCLYAFSERPILSWPWLMLACYSALVPTLFWLLPLPETDLLELLLHRIPGYIEYLLIAAGLWVVIDNWSSDLIESRRHLRVVLTAMVGVTVLLTVVLVNFHWGDVVLQRLVVILCLFGTSYYLLVIPRGILFGVTEPLPGARSNLEKPPNSTVPEAQASPSAELQQLETLMSSGFYKTEKLTIAVLARKLEMPEYILRRLINEQLGFRNFNDYVNSWRIEEAQKQLLEDPEKPIMNISLDLGYRTLSSFNRAFKERVDLTPSQYRQNTIPESEAH